jgi:hypothetical protein
MTEFAGSQKLATLSEILVECSYYEEDFWTFAVEHEQTVRVALYAKSVADGYAVATEKLISECDDAIEVLQGFLDEADNEQE